MFSHQILCGKPHLLHIQRIVGKVGVQPFHRHGELSAVNAIFVGLSTHTMPGVPILCHFLGLLNADILRQSLIQCIRHLLCRHRANRIKHCDISKSMNTGVGATGTDHFDLLPKQAAQRLVQHRLYGNSVFLQLPAVVIGSVVGNRQTYSFLTHI